MSKKGRTRYSPSFLRVGTEARKDPAFVDRLTRRTGNKFTG
jgi:hypothetical protein